MATLTAADKSIIRNIVSRLHVSTDDTEISLLMAEKCPKASPSFLREVCREAIRAHRKNQDLYRSVMKGGF